MTLLSPSMPALSIRKDRVRVDECSLGFSLCRWPGFRRDEALWCDGGSCGTISIPLQPCKVGGGAQTSAWVLVSQGLTRRSEHTGARLISKDWEDSLQNCVFFLGGNARATNDQAFVAEEPHPLARSGRRALHVCAFRIPHSAKGVAARSLLHCKLSVAN